MYSTETDPSTLDGAYQRTRQALQWHIDAAADLSQILSREEVNGRPLDAQFLAVTTADLETTAALLQPDRLILKAWNEIPVSR